MTKLEKFDLESKDIKIEQIARLREMFPEVITEGKVDFEKFKQCLGEDLEKSNERYGMSWAGKSGCFKIIQEPSLGTLKPVKNESIDFDTTENLFIEGDNLEILKLLQKSYYEKIKMIYIDPPYNTGQEFIYPDKFAENLQTYLMYTGQIDAEGRKFSTNTDTSGRYHSNWMNMMYPRLFLAKNLLKDDGVIFVSIDDHEVHNLRVVMNEIFGEENFIDCIIWKKRYGGGAKEKHLVTLHEYILFYSKNINMIEPIFIPYSNESIDKYYVLKDEKYSDRGGYRTHPLEAGKAMGERKNLVFPIFAPDKTKILPKRQWLWSKERVELAIKNNELEFIKGKEGYSVHTKQYLKDENGNIRQGKAFSIIDDVYSQHGTNEILDLFKNAQIFPYPKPTGFMKPLIKIGMEHEDIILDFFAGSGTTAHTVLDLNMEDGAKRKFICVQLPEPTLEDSEAFKAGYKNIAEIAKERIRRVIKKIRVEQKTDQKTLTKNEKSISDIGFKVFKLDKSNFKLWNTKSDDIQTALTEHIEQIRESAKVEDILYEILLKDGFELTTNVNKIKIKDKDVYSIEDNMLLICLDNNLTLELFKEMKKLNPHRVIVMDKGFKDNDQLKTNSVENLGKNDAEEFILRSI